MSAMTAAGHFKITFCKHNRTYVNSPVPVPPATAQDLVFPTEIVGKRTRCKIDGSKILKVQLDPKDQVRERVGYMAALKGAEVFQ